MNEEQQKLYDNLLKKVNEYCLGFAAEDVIESIDALVDTYECTGQTPSEALNAIKEQMPKYDEVGTVEVSKADIRSIETALINYQKCMNAWDSGHSVDFSKVRFEIQNLLPDPVDTLKKLKALEIIKKYINIEETGGDLFPYHIEEYQYTSSSSEKIITKEEYELLKEILK